MKANKIYGNAIYVNNEKMILSQKSISVLKYDASPIDGSLSSRVIEALEFAAGSKEDIDIINISENAEIVEIDKEAKGFHFSGFAVLVSGICTGVYVDRDGRMMSSVGQNANEFYNKLNN